MSRPAPLATVGVIGAGQLGRMLALAGYPLGIVCQFLDRSADMPGGQVGKILVGDLEDPVLLGQLAASADVLTFDWENIPAAALAPLAKLAPIRPPAAALEASQDRLLEKALFTALGIPSAAHTSVDTLQDLLRAIDTLGMPGILKTRRLGYDGKGQALIKSRADAERAFASLGQASLIYERFVKFSREVSLLAVRSTRKEVAFYPLTENTHIGGVLRFSAAPYLDKRVLRLAHTYVKRLLDRLEYVGVLAVEFFVSGGHLIANEMAPRVHNSGHWTIEGAVTSQFENHLRAICGLPLGSTRAVGHSAMVNFLGTMPDRERLLKIPGLAYHDYGKAPRPGRKIGHCTVLARSAAERDRALARVRRWVKQT
jgi:5-(carboxyamino)imidazole ribonucleotide synthase